METIKSIKGTHDILPSEAYKWRFVEDKVRQICADFGFKEIRVPVFEYTELFKRGVGDTTDVVQKEMYTFIDKGGRDMTLRPEGTAGVVRSLLEHSLDKGTLPVKLFYIMTCYRNENPQAGRYREFWQFGVETFGSASPLADVEIIAIAVEFLKRIGLTGLVVNINSIGCPVCRNEYNKRLIEFLGSRVNELCLTCKGRVERNPLRVLDCKEKKCAEAVKGAPMLIDSLCGECSIHFDSVQGLLSDMGITYGINPKIVRGLDYYTKTVFEITSDSLGAQSTVCGGGRYDGLVEELGGIPLPGIGFGLGIERLLMCMDGAGVAVPQEDKPLLFVAYIGEKAQKEANRIVSDLRSEGISAQMDIVGRSLKAQMKYADKTGALYSVVLGDNEVDSGIADIKAMTTGDKEHVKLCEIGEYLKGVEVK